MKVNELRIGNWVLIPYQNSPIAIPAHETQVQGITIFGEIQTNNTPEHEGLKTHYNHVSGIPLTEEWLLKFGFITHDNHDYFIDISSVCDIHSWFSVFKADDFYYIDAFDIKIRYVHQLQNLYFALTGEELEIIK